MSSQSLLCSADFAPRTSLTSTSTRVHPGLILAYIASAPANILCNNLEFIFPLVAAPWYIVTFKYADLKIRILSHGTGEELAIHNLCAFPYF